MNPDSETPLSSIIDEFAINEYMNATHVLRMLSPNIVPPNSFMDRYSSHERLRVDYDDEDGFEVSFFVEPEFCGSGESFEEAVKGLAEHLERKAQSLRAMLEIKKEYDADTK